MEPGSSSFNNSIREYNAQPGETEIRAPLIAKEKKLVVCRVDIDGEIKENKPLYFPGLDWYKDFKLSVLGPKDIKVLQHSLQLGI